MKHIRVCKLNELDGEAHSVFNLECLLACLLWSLVWWAWNAAWLPSRGTANVWLWRWRTSSRTDREKPDRPGKGGEEWGVSLVVIGAERPENPEEETEGLATRAKKGFPWFHPSGAQRHPQHLHQEWATKYLISAAWISFPTGGHLKWFHVGTIDPDASEGQITCVGRDLHFYLYRIPLGWAKRHVIAIVSDFPSVSFLKVILMWKLLLKQGWRCE